MNERESYAAMVKRLKAHPGYDEQYRMRLRQMVERQTLPQGTPIRWYHRLWWRLLSWVRRVGGMSEAKDRLQAYVDAFKRNGERRLLRMEDLCEVLADLAELEAQKEILVEGLKATKRLADAEPGIVAQVGAPALLRDISERAGAALENAERIELERLMGRGK